MTKSKSRQFPLLLLDKVNKNKEQSKSKTSLEINDDEKQTKDEDTVHRPGLKGK
jgi:hypothetical protein